MARINSKDDAINFLQEQKEYFLLCGKLFPLEEYFFVYSANQMLIMINTIIHNDDFFNHIFKDKTEDEVKQWIEKEAKQWLK